MTIHIDTIHVIVILAVMFLITIISLTTTIVVTIKMKSLKLQVEDNNRLLYFNLKDIKELHMTSIKCINDLDSMREDVNTLSSGLQLKLQKEEEKARIKRYPKPAEVEDITSTINDQIFIQSVLRSQQKAPIGGAIPDITDIVRKTYPDINEEYLATRVIAVMQSSM